MENEARELLERLEQRRLTAISSWWVPLVGIIILVLLCYGLRWLENQRLKRLGGEVSMIIQQQPPRLVYVPSRTMSKSFISVEIGAGGYDDLILYTTVPTITDRNLTRTPVITEMWPVLSPSAEQIVYYALRGTVVDLYLVPLLDGAPLSLTEAADDSGLHVDYEIAPVAPPAFSPDSRWVAFLAQSIEQNRYEPFIARTDGQQVLHVNSLGLNVSAYTWLDNATLLVKTQSSDSAVQLWIVSLMAPGELKLRSFD